jgi:hypothetical protein
MATLAVTLPADGGGFLRSLAKRIAELSYDLPDQTPTGTPNVLTFDNAPGQGTLSIQITSGAYQTGKKKQ